MNSLETAETHVDHDAAMEAARSAIRGPSREYETLMRFYAVATLEDLVYAQERHVQSLQNKLERFRSSQPDLFTQSNVRQG